MAYATLTYYKTTYVGETASDADITKWLNRASDDLDALSILPIDITTMSADQLDLLAKATCAQAEGYIQGGGEEFVGSVSLGGFSMNGGAKKSGGLFDRAARYAFRLGLLNRSVASMPGRNLQELSSGGVIPEECE
jgi:hypothetical protein